MMVSDGNEFKQVVKGINFITPTVSGYWQSGDYQCELSRGTDFEGAKVYGVTVVNTDTMKPEHDLSKLFPKRGQALAYIKALGRYNMKYIPVTEQELLIEQKIDELAKLLDNQYNVKDEFLAVISDAVNSHIELIEEQQ